jgi:hypothetical protein
MSNDRNLWLSAVALLAAAPLPEAAADWIELSNGQRRDGVQITAARWDSVQYTIGKAPPTTLSGEQVVALHRDSTFLEAGRDALEGGDHAKAISLLGSVGQTAKDWEQAEARFLIARAHVLSGKVREADQAFKAYLEKWKPEKDWWVPHAVQELADALLAARQPGTAEIRYKELAEFGGHWAFRSKLGQGFAVLQSKGEPGALQARRLFDEVARAAQAPPALKQQAVVGRSQAFLLQNQPQQAIKELEAEFFSATSGEAGYTPGRAEATLLMGRAHAALGGKENLEHAEIWFLRAVALYRKQGETYAQACALLTDVYTKLGQKSRADDWKAKGAAPAAPAGGGGGR